jgi:hypothetical protein
MSANEQTKRVAFKGRAAVLCVLQAATGETVASGPIQTNREYLYAANLAKSVGDRTQGYVIFIFG